MQTDKITAQATQDAGDQLGDDIHIFITERMNDGWELDEAKDYLAETYHISRAIINAYYDQDCGDV